MQSTPAPEKIRLVIWDLDETFWTGTLTEGGITYRRDFHDIVVALAQRGIVSSICSKNDLAPVQEILEREGIWQYFVFPSINWEPKGPRLAALVEAVQLRAPTILFIDDNPMNRAEAQHFVPGMQVADETVIPALLDNPLCKGKDDRGLTRLAQYQLLQRRQADEKQAASQTGGDTTEFLRSSNIRLSIEHDLEAHLDRAVELINRTNQLNFTKTRLPEDPEAARTELRALLSGYRVQAGIIRVRDNYGDYGYCGLYVIRGGSAGFRLLHFCFSCRILNMGVESWLYQHLGRPALKVEGEVLSDVKRDERDIDWITVQLPHQLDSDAPVETLLDTVYARGGCDLHAVTHYFSVVAKEVTREFNISRAGANLRFDHSMFSHYAMRGISEEAMRAAAVMGYEADDFRQIVPEPVDGGGRTVWLLSFWADADFALYRHRTTGVMLPLCLPHTQTGQRDMTKIDPATIENPQAAAMLTSVQKQFDYAGMIDEGQFKDNARALLARAPAQARIFILMANETLVAPDGQERPAPKKQMLNRWVREVTAGMPHVELLPVRDFVQGDNEVITNNHFDRMVYFRVYEHIMKRVQDAPAAAAA